MIRVAVTGGGEPTPDQMAALVMALRRRPRPGADRGGTAETRRWRMSPWTRAARLEGAGAGRLEAADQLRNVGGRYGWH